MAGPHAGQGKGPLGGGSYSSSPLLRPRRARAGVWRCQDNSYVRRQKKRPQLTLGPLLSGYLKRASTLFWDSFWDSFSPTRVEAGRGSGVNEVEGTKRFVAKRDGPGR